MDLIKIENKDGKLKTDSLNVAEVFSKRHDHVLRDIESLSCSADFREPNFGLSFYNRDIDGFDRKYKKYEITKDGLVFLIMGYSGEKAGAMKEAYINQFNEMEKALSKSTLPATYAEALQLAADQARALEAAAPAIEYHGKIQANSESISVGEMAKQIFKNGVDTGRNRLFKLLIEHKYLISRVEPYQKYMSLGYFEVQPVDVGGYVHQQIFITGKGQTHIARKFGKLPTTAPERQLNFMEVEA